MAFGMLTPVRGIKSTTFAGVTPPPPTGTVTPGELLIDAQSRTIWLGVDTSVDPTQSILISDMASLVQADIDNLAAAKAFTDSRLIGDSGQAISSKGYSPRDHKHSHSDINDWDDAVENVIKGSAYDFKYGMIILWFGDPTYVGNNNGPYDMTGWAVCDGRDARTPNLADRFVVCMGPKNANQDYNTLNPNALKQTTLDGEHRHGNYTEPFALRGQEMGLHAHPIAATTHTHQLDGEWEDIYTGTTGARHYKALVDKGGSVHSSKAAGIGIANTGNNVVAAPPGNSHVHAIPLQAGHTHGMPIDVYKAIPYFVLCYIMKIS